MTNPPTATNRSEKLSCKLAQLATNVRYRWSQDRGMEKLDPGKPLMIMGAMVQAKPDDVSAYRQAVVTETRKLAWSSYRSRLPELPPPFTSDVGWGCSIRVCQMLLLETLSRHLKVPFEENPFLLANFVCENGSNGVFSLQRFVEMGRRVLGKEPGDWYSPDGVSHVLRYLLAENPLIEGLKVSIACNNIISKREILADMTGLSCDDITCHCATAPATCPLCSGFLWQGAVLVLVPLMLGERKVTRTKYYEALRLFLGMKQGVGIVGAKPGFAMYFVGYQEDCFLCLDPHYVQKCPKNDDNLLKHISTYQNPTLTTLPMAEAGSSMSLGFYFESNEAFSAFQSQLAETEEIHEGLVVVESGEIRGRGVAEELEFVD